MQGTPIYTIKELMGHKTLAMTERYAHLLPDHKRAAIEQMVAGLKQKDITSIKTEESAG